MLRWYLTPERLHRIYSHISHTCWKGCGDKGSSYLACLWPCRFLQSFWENMANHIQSIMEICLPLSLDLFLFNSWHAFQGSSLYKDLIALLFSATKGLIVFYWKSITISSISEWYMKVWGLVVYVLVIQLNDHLIFLPLVYDYAVLYLLFFICMLRILRMLSDKIMKCLKNGGGTNHIQKNCKGVAHF